MKSKLKEALAQFATYFPNIRMPLPLSMINYQKQLRLFLPQYINGLPYHPRGLNVWKCEGGPWQWNDVCRNTSNLLSLCYAFKDVFEAWQSLPLCK